MQAEKAKLQGDLAALQVKLDNREVQYQDAVRQLNISKFMLSESDEARSEVGFGPAKHSVVLWCNQYSCRYLSRLQSHGAA